MEERGGRDVGLSQQLDLREERERESDRERGGEERDDCGARVSGWGGEEANLEGGDHALAGGGVGVSLGSVASLGRESATASCFAGTEVLALLVHKCNI